MLVQLIFNIIDDCGLNGLELILVEVDISVLDVNGNGVIDVNEFVVDIIIVVNYDGNGLLIYNGFYSIGMYSLCVVLIDGCGNIVSYYIIFMVGDCSVIVLICVNGLIVMFMLILEGDCVVVIWVSDYLGSLVFDCFGLLQYVIYCLLEVEVVGEGFVFDLVCDGLILIIVDLQNIVLYIYVIDQVGNFDYCEIYVLV